jgi:glycosyltransferase involved in cell wall biosynthesis
MKQVAGHVDIFVPTYNHEPYIEDCINSIFLQDYKNFTVYVIDDQSSDSTFDKVMELKRKWGSQLQVYRNKTRIGTGSKSILINDINLNGEFWAILEGDDYWLDSKKLTMQIDALKKSPRAIAVATKCMMLNSISGTSEYIAPDVLEWNYFDLILNGNKNRHFCHISSIVWRNLFPNQSVPWPPKYISRVWQTGNGDEVLLMHDVLEASMGTFIYLDYVASIYRYTGKGLWSSLSDIQQNQANYLLKREIRKRMSLRNQMYALYIRAYSYIPVGIKSSKFPIN